MSTLHVNVGERDGNDEVNVEVVDHVGDQPQQNDETRIFEVGHLNVHGAELDPPANVGSLGGGRLEPQGVPVGRLQVLEVAHEVLVVNLLLHELTFVGRNRVAREQASHVICKPLVDLTIAHEHVLVLLDNRYRLGVVVAVLHVLVVRDVVVHGRVPGLGDEAGAGRVALLPRPAVHALLNYCPPQVEVRKFSFLDRTGRREGTHDAGEGQEHVVEVARMADGHALVGYLEAALAHAEVHGVHEDAPGVGLVLSGLRQIGFLVLVNRHPNIHFLAATLANRLYQAGEAGVGVDGGVDRELGLGGRVEHRQILLILLDELVRLGVLEENVIWRPQRRNIS
mmetsp:Transcript_5437/g.9172  ORF Transcript_5437/g.9172 Transcript_5437/m.9172 type:complete len:339 (+) Transcript_5437:1060-2076(+)